MAVLAVTPKNVDAAMVLLFLYKVVQVLVNYFNVLEEESIKDNFVIIYELLDEMMDFGYPQATDAKILKECVAIDGGKILGHSTLNGFIDRFITQDSYKLQKEIRPAPSLSTAVPWRNSQVKYPTNEVFLDVIEKVNLLVNEAGYLLCLLLFIDSSIQVSANGTMLRSDLVGNIRVKPELSGMPNVSLGLNERVQVESASSCTGLSLRIWWVLLSLTCSLSGWCWQQRDY